MAKETRRYTSFDELPEIKNTHSNVFSLYGGVDIQHNTIVDSVHAWTELIEVVLERIRIEY